MAFSVTGRGLRRWPDPHPDQSPREAEYSRILDPRKWRILGARAEAWLGALVDTGLADIGPGASVAWRAAPRSVISQVDLVVPRVADALPLIVARSRLGDVDDAGVTLGVGDPAVCVEVFPYCGCDACDSGSQAELENLDRHILGIVAGVFRRLSDGSRMITVIETSGWAASGRFRRREVEAILADPTGWEMLAGGSWLNPS